MARFFYALLRKIEKVPTSISLSTSTLPPKDSIWFLVINSPRPIASLLV